MTPDQAARAMAAANAASAGGVVLGAPGARPPQAALCEPATDDLVQAKACPFTSGIAAIQASPAQFMIFPKYVPCHRKCAMFVNEPKHPDKGWCALNPPHVFSVNVSPNDVDNPPLTT